MPGEYDVGDLEVVPVDPVDPEQEDALHSVWEVAHEAAAVDHPFDLMPPWSTARETWRLRRPDYRSWYWIARTGDEVHGSAVLSLPMLDNLHLADTVFHVRPGQRRQGIGRRLLATVVGQARAEGRAVLMATPGSPMDRTGPGEAMLQASGFEVAITATLKAADLTAGAADEERLAASVAPQHAAYRLATWSRRVPEELVEGYCRLAEAFVDEAPMGDLDYEPEVWTAERVHRRDDVFDTTGRHQFGVLAFAPDGSCVGSTELFVNQVASWRALQGGTLVLPGHRGHRLGMALKLANHRQLRETYPDCTHIFTDNAGVNAPMNAVNDLLGFRDVERSLEMQLRL